MAADVFDLDAYAYDLPEHLIAQYPLSRRDHARLMIIDRASKSIRHDTFNHIARYLPSKSTFVINNSRVIPARLLGVKKDTQGQVEVFLLKALNDGYSFEALLKPLKKINVGQTLCFGNELTAVLVDKDRRIVRFNQKNVLKILERTGHIPLPPYIKRDDAKTDKKDYQTVYAKQPGSVAAPTAGLHFTRSLMTQMTLKGHRFLPLTLHIGYGTFKPVECADIRDHQIHEEAYEVSVAVHKKLLSDKKKKRPICAVGTTSCRVLETLGRKGNLSGITNLFAYPGFSFTMTDHLVTNFHLPHSSLLMLVSAFGGYELIRQAYQEAIKKEYRFYSYGDAMLII